MIRYSWFGSDYTAADPLPFPNVLQEFVLQELLFYQRWKRSGFFTTDTSTGLLVMSGRTVTGQSQSYIRTAVMSR
jgi:hypothetical protein